MKIPMRPILGAIGLFFSASVCVVLLKHYCPTISTLEQMVQWR